MPEVERRRITMPLPYSPSSPLNFIINSTTHDSAPNFTFPATDDDFNSPFSDSPGVDASGVSGDASPVLMSPWNPMSPFRSSPWRSAGMNNSSTHGNGIQQESRIDGFIGSLFREEGHIYSLASSGDLLYTGSDSKNIHVWKNLTEFTAFKCNSGFVKAIIVSGDRIFTGQQDGKVRVWKKSKGNSTNHKLVGTFPTFFDILKSSMRRQNYVAVKRNCTAIWIKHCDAISCLSIDEEQGLLYSGSWDRTFKVWNTSNSKCYESVKAHDDAVNAIVATRSGTIFTGSADGSIKVWKREYIGKSTKHSYVETLLSQQCAVTALAVPKTGSFVYSGLSNGSINFWEWEKQLTHGGVLTRHKLAVLCLAVAGKLLVSGSADKTICVWKREGSVHGCLSVLTGHTGPVKCLAVERDEGRRSGEMRWVVYSGSLDKSVRVWSVSEKSSEMMVQSGNGKYSNI